MKRLLTFKAAALLLAVCLLVLLAGCGEKAHQYRDGTYSAEFKEYDSRGFKDYLVVVVEGGNIVSVEFDALNEAGQLRSQDTAYAAEMRERQNTDPTTYATNLGNQLLAEQNIDDVLPVAGATYSSNAFKALFRGLEPNLESGDTTRVIVDNVPQI